MKNGKKPTHLAGFTLFELLVSLFILTTIGSIILGIFIVSVRSTTKVNNIQLIRQNGNFVLSQMSRMIQFSQEFSGVSVDGSTFVTTCQAPGASLTQYKHVKFKSIDDGETTFSCSASPSSIASNSAALIDTNVLAVSNCSFTCTQISQDTPQTVGITFTLSKIGTTNLIEDPSPQQFQTSVTLRNTAY